MKLELDRTYLINTDQWFIAPDGNDYRAVFGTVKNILTDKDALGIVTNRGATNWYVEIGNMLVGGCQIHYAIQTDNVSFMSPTKEIEHEGRLTYSHVDNTRIYNADYKGYV